MLFHIVKIHRGRRIYKSAKDNIGAGEDNITNRDVS